MIKDNESSVEGKVLELLASDGFGRDMTPDRKYADLSEDAIKLLQIMQISGAIERTNIKDAFLICGTNLILHSNGVIHVSDNTLELLKFNADK